MKFRLECIQINLLLLSHSVALLFAVVADVVVVVVLVLVAIVVLIAVVVAAGAVLSISPLHLSFLVLSKLLRRRTTTMLRHHLRRSFGFCTRSKVFLLSCPFSFIFCSPLRALSPPYGRVFFHFCTNFFSFPFSFPFCAFAASLVRLGLRGSRRR